MIFDRAGWVCGYITPPLAESVWNTTAHLDGGVVQVARAAGASQISIYWPCGAGGRRERWRRAQYGWFIFTWPHSLTPVNMSALRKSLKIIKELMSMIEMCSGAEVRREVDGHYSRERGSGMICLLFWFELGEMLKKQHVTANLCELKTTGACYAFLRCSVR